MDWKIRNRIDCIAARVSGLVHDQFVYASKEPMVTAMSTTKKQAIVSSKSFVFSFFFGFRRNLLHFFLSPPHIIDDYYYTYVRRHRVVFNFRMKKENNLNSFGCREENSFRFFTHIALALHFTHQFVNQKYAKNRFFFRKGIDTIYADWFCCWHSRYHFM